MSPWLPPIWAFDVMQAVVLAANLVTMRSLYRWGRALRRREAAILLAGRGQQ